MDDPREIFFCSRSNSSKGEVQNGESGVWSSKVEVLPVRIHGANEFPGGLREPRSVYSDSS